MCHMVFATHRTVGRMVGVARLRALRAVATFSGTFLFVTAFPLAFDGQRRMDADGVHDDDDVFWRNEIKNGILIKF